MKIAVITTSRADYGIYYPLLRALAEDSFFSVELIVLGSHLSKEHGYTIADIQKDGFHIAYQIDHSFEDSPKGIVKAISEITWSTAEIWNKEKSNVDLIICLGDRFEMHAVVFASVPFNMPVAHFHGGETSLGAIDNIYRNSLSVLASYHFCSSEHHAKRVSELKGSSHNVFNVGSLSFENLKHLELLSPEEFTSQYEMALNENTVLLTFHPETINYEKNVEYTKTISEVIKSANQFNFIITLPNTDTNNHFIRNEFLTLSQSLSHVQVTENLGTLGYFSCLSHCKFVMGNSSSGIIEAAFFGKYALNIGNRQKGRQHGDNVIHSPIIFDNLVSCMTQITEMGEFQGEVIFQKENTTERVIEILKSIDKSE